MKKTLILLLIITVIAIGCSANSGAVTDTSSTDASEATTAAGAVETATDQPLVASTAISSELDNIDPWLSAAADTKAVMRNVFEGLLWYDTTGNLTPSLAKSWQVSDDGLNYTFALREDVKFHNGDAFDAADVVYSIEALAGLSGSEPLSSRFSNVNSIEAIDQMTVKISLNEPDAAFLVACTEAILPVGYGDQATQPVGTGPFKFQSYEPGQKVVLVKNDAYWDVARLPQIDKVEFYIMSDPTAVINGLKSGQLDFADIDPKNIPLVEGEFEILAAPQNMIQLLALNNQRAPFDDIRVRQALNFAIDKEQIIAAVANGYGTKLDSNMSPSMKVFYNDGIALYAADVARAKQLLADAGYPNGFTTSITVPSNYQFHVDTAQVVANQLLQIGVKAEIKQVEWGVWLDEVYKQFNYDTTIIGLAGKLDPHQVLVRYQSDYKRNFMQFNDADYDRLLAQASVENDLAKRVELYKNCQQILAEKAAAVYIMDPNLVVAMRKGVSGFNFYPVRFLDMATIKLSQ